MAPLRVLVVDDRPLYRLVVRALCACPGTSQFALGAFEAVRLAAEQDFDLILLDVGRSVLAGMSTAAHIRQAERVKACQHRARLVACAASESDCRDCLVPGSALSGALRRPEDAAAMCACLERWGGGKFPPH